MTDYIPVIIWLLSAVICLCIAQLRRVKSTTLRATFVAVFGPLAIPLVLLTKPEKFN